MSNIVNRRLSPGSEELENFHIVEGKKISLKNGVDIHYVNAGDADVLRIDFVFDAGTRKQTQNTVAGATNAMLSEGTKTLSAQQIADNLDFYGAYFQTRNNADDSLVTLYCLKKHFSSCIPYILDVISNSVFPETELSIYKQNAIQRLMVNKQRNSFLSRRMFYSSIFGNTHPYGTLSESIDYEKISRETLENFFKSQYQNKVKYILIAGVIDDGVLKQSETFFDELTPSKATKNILTSSGIIGEKSFFNKPDSVQSAIRIGRKMFNRTHADFRKMQLLNLILGGYFGSRLMKNIREEKGLTYGIYSVMESYLDDGCFYIDTEINNELRQTGLKEIYKEIAVLRDQIIPEEELNIAKNYLLGSFLRSIDGPFSLADRHKILVDYDLDYSFYYSFIDSIKKTTAKELQDLANIYWKESDLTEIVVGKQ